MTVENWAFFTAENGNELSRGWQGYEDQARKIAQRMANDMGEAVEFISEATLRAYVADSDDEAPLGEVVDPEEGCAMSTTRVQDAIVRSVSHRETVHLDYDAETHETTLESLLAECEDSADHPDGETEFWGTTESGSEWRVHVDGAAAGARLRSLLDEGKQSPLAEGTADDVVARAIARRTVR